MIFHVVRKYTWTFSLAAHFVKKIGGAVVWLEDVKSRLYRFVGLNLCVCECAIQQFRAPCSAVCLAIHTAIMLFNYVRGGISTVLFLALRRQL